ncbi:uncharacterized protein LOC5517849 [Nematostella vectensis]|nr:uncharacterized protein LOC5517849 [Nematostella vectensis]
MKPKTRRNAFVGEGLEEPEDGLEPEEVEESHTEYHSEEAQNSEEADNKFMGLTLTSEQVMAFKEVFDLFDSNGGGTIDAEELDLALRSVDIQLTQEEIVEVLMAMDKDGNGEIDFGEFLHLMTNTERFLEGFDTNCQSSRKRRETTLFEALTQFMKRSALHSINEIVGFYHTRYKRTQAPHVVGHYAAGARLIGLTETQLRKHMEKLKANHAAGDEKSPYAEPLHIVFGTTSKKKRKKRKVDSKEVDLTGLVQGRRDTACGRIRLQFMTPALFQKPSEPPTENGQSVAARKATINSTLPHRRNKPQPKTYKRNGWVAQRILPFAVELPMPRPKCTSKVKSALLSQKLTFDDLPDIRDKVAMSKQKYFERLHDRKRKEREKHWEALGPSHIHSDVLRNYFRIAFHAYTPYAHIDKPRVRPDTSRNCKQRSKSVTPRKLPHVETKLRATSSCH